MGSDLPHNQINAIYKSSDGFMWFGTGAGLVRYDGYRFRSFQYDPTDSTSLAGNSVEEITEDADGLLWVRTEGGTYSIYNPRTERFNRNITEFLHSKGLEGSLERIFTGSDGSTWYYLKGQGLYHNGEHLPIGINSLPVNNLTDIDETEGYIILAYNDGSVIRVRKEDVSIEERLTKISDLLPKNHYEYFRVFPDADGRIWIYGTSELWVYNPASGEWLDTNALSKIRIESLLQAPDGKIWIGANNGGIVLLDGKMSLKALENDEGLSSSTVSALYEDAEGTIWLGTYKNGVAYYNESVYKFSLKEVGDINCIEEIAPGRLLLGTNGRGILEYSLNDGKTSVFRGYSSGAILSILRDSSGRIWIGKYWGGLDCISGGMTRHYGASQGALASDNVWTLAEDADGNIWIGTLGGGVQRLNPAMGEFITFNSLNSALASDFISNLCVTKGGKIVAGNSSLGVSLIDPTSGIVSSLCGESSVQGVNQIIEDRRGLIWVGTRSGIYYYDPADSTVRNVVLEACIRSTQYISAVCENEDGDIWVTTAGTAVKIEVSEGQSFSAKSYDSHDGLQKDGLNQRAVKKLSTGEVVFGGVNGINMTNSGALKTNQTIPAVMFTGLSLFDKKVEIGQRYDGRVVLPEAIGGVDGIRLRHRQNMFSVEFSSGEYTQPQKATMLYKLEGFDKDWMQASSIEPCATYTNLDPGKYTLLVKAINSDGYESTSPASLCITITPPFHRTVWAYILYVLAAAGVFVFAIGSVRRGEKDKYRIKQAEEAARRTEEINEMKLRFYTNISHDLRTPLTLIISPLEDMMRRCKDKVQKTKMELMHRNALSLSDMIGQLLDFRKSEENSLRLNLSDGDVVAFVKDTCTAFMGITEKRGVNLTFYSPLSELLMAFDKEKLGRIVANLLSNAFKYTPDGSRVDVTVEKAEGDMLGICVSDTGTGVADEFKESIFNRYFRLENPSVTVGGNGIGLSLVKDFAQLLGGDVSVSDNVPCGSVFMVRVPIRKPSAPIAVPSEKPVEKSSKPLVLIVEDNIDLLTLLSDNLGLYFRVLTATDGAEAWNLVQKHLPDIVLTDIMMPVMDGNELCGRIKGTATTSHIPVVFLTARQDAAYQAEVLRAGADDYIVKPFNMEILLLRLRRLLSKNDNKIEPAPSRIQITPLDVKLVEQATKYIEENMSRTDMTVEDLSAAMSMSRTNLYKKLLRITGKTPLDFIRTIRLKRAAQLLSESQLGVAEIAYMVGYNNQRYFSTSFQKEFGVLPSDFKKHKI